MTTISPVHIPLHAPPAPSVAMRREDVSQGKEAGASVPDMSHGSRGEAGAPGKPGRGNRVVSPKGQNPGQLTPEEERQVQELRRRDREVRAHEQAHIAAGGRYVRGGASFEYVTGPDGKKYATGGEVSIDTSKEQDPEATIRKMETVIKAALAPARPSSVDRAVAVRAQARKAEASAELAQQRRSAETGESGAGKTDSTGGKLEGSRSAASSASEPAINSYRSVAVAGSGRAPASTVNFFV